MSTTRLEKSGHGELKFDPLSRVFGPGTIYQSSVDAVKNVILKHPGATLLISAGIGVFLGCLIKRR
jgi:hypothetical protein